MPDLISIMYNYLLARDFWNFFSVLFNQYIPYGMFFWMIGLIIFVITHMKTKNLAYASLLVSFYFVSVDAFGIITNIYSAMAMRYIGIVIGIVAGYYIYRAWKG